MGQVNQISKWVREKITFTKLLIMTLNLSHIEDHRMLKYSQNLIKMIDLMTYKALITDISAFDDPHCDSL